MSWSEERCCNVSPDGLIPTGLCGTVPVRKSVKAIQNKINLTKGGDKISQNQCKINTPESIQNKINITKGGEKIPYNQSR